MYFGKCFEGLSLHNSFKLLKVKPQDTNNCEDLAKQLTEGMSRDIQQVRAIYTWVISQNVQEIEFPANSIINSPMDILKRMKDGRSSYTTLFTLLCRYVEYFYLENW